MIVNKLPQCGTFYLFIFSTDSSAGKSDEDTHTEM